ncbi:MAG: AAA family ATPase [Elusimicrobia bacterium]|nr:AAA family ATPase [Elusimicrobiota bacterium]
MASRLFELDELAKKQAEKYTKRRHLYQQVAAQKGRAFSGIIGPRGVGKTVLLRQLARDAKDAFYISADTLGADGLFDTAKTLTQKYGVRLLLIDEIHFASGYAAELKRMHDFLDTRVVFTSSVALSLAESAQDLSRRVLLRPLWPFTFREFLDFAHGKSLPALTLSDILDRRWQPEHLRQGHLFDEYIKGGLFPFALEQPETAPVLESILDTVVRRDIPQVAGLRAQETSLLEKLLRFVGQSACEGISYSSISRNLGLTKYKAEQYVRLLDQAFVLNAVMPAGTNVLREPKVLMFLPMRRLYRTDEEAVGGLREDFTAQALRMAGLKFDYLKNTRGAKTPDFLVAAAGGSIVVEVGGKGKGRTQFKGCRAHRKLILTPSDSIEGDRRPLALFGFL